MSNKIEICGTCHKYEDVCRCKLRGVGACEINKCSRTSFYIWHPRSFPERAQRMCKEHGEMTAGNFKDELEWTQGAKEGA